MGVPPNHPILEVIFHYKIRKTINFPLVNQHDYGKSTIFNGKTHYQWPFSIAILT
jgi:hypothetical protein